MFLEINNNNNKHHKDNEFFIKNTLKYLINSKNHFQQLQEDGTGYGSAFSLLIENYPDFVLLAAYGF